MGSIQFAQRLQLDEQAFAQVACSNAQWFQGLELAQHVFNALNRYMKVFGNLANADFQVAAFVEVANQLLGNGRVIGRDQRFQLLQQRLGQRFARRNAGYRVKVVVFIAFACAVGIDLVKRELIAPLRL